MGRCLLLEPSWTPEDGRPGDNSTLVGHGTQPFSIALAITKALRTDEGSSIAKVVGSNKENRFISGFSVPFGVRLKYLSLAIEIMYHDLALVQVGGLSDAWAM